MLINLLIINMENKLKRKSKVSVFELLVLTGCMRLPLATTGIVFAENPKLKSTSYSIILRHSTYCCIKGHYTCFWETSHLPLP